MSLRLLLEASKTAPPGHILPKHWPRLSGNGHVDRTYDPPIYQINETLRDQLLSYFEPEIYFDYTPSSLEKDGVWDVSTARFAFCTVLIACIF